MTIALEPAACELLTRLSKSRAVPTADDRTLMLQMIAHAAVNAGYLEAFLQQLDQTEVCRTIPDERIPEEVFAALPITGLSVLTDMQLLGMTLGPGTLPRLAKSVFLQSRRGKSHVRGIIKTALGTTTRINLAVVHTVKTLLGRGNARVPPGTEMLHESFYVALYLGLLAMKK